MQSEPDGGSTIELRALRRDDSIEALTALLHRGYAQLGALGFRYKAVDQSPDVTRERISLYQRRGYRHVGFAQWSHTNYRSIVLSKTLV